MEQLLIAVAAWLHALASVIFVGYYIILSVIYLPILKQAPPEDPDSPARTVMVEISRHSRTWLYLSMLIFIFTGIYLTYVNSNYLGLGNFSNPWAILMLIKHILIAGMIVAGFWYNAILRVGPMLRSKTGSTIALNRFRSYVYSMAIAGGLVLLLTALSQTQ